MSAALQFPALARAAAAQRQVAFNRTHQGPAAAASPGSDASPASPLRAFGPQAERFTGPHQPALSSVSRPAVAQQRADPPPNLIFYRKQTETLLRRYLYASMLVGRAPTILMEPLIRGWASYRPVHTFEDCVIFVLDMESALARLGRVDRLLLTRVVLQEYSIGEAALLAKKPERVIYRRLSEALDRLTWILMKNGTMEMPGREGAKELDGELDE